MRSWEVGQFAKKVPRNPRHKAREVSFVKRRRVEPKKKGRNFNFWSYIEVTSTQSTQSFFESPLGVSFKQSTRNKNK